MLQTGPEIHGHRPDLDLHLGLHRPIRQINRDRHYHMIAFVTIRFWILDVIFDVKDRHIPLSGDHVGNLVNIRRKRTDDTDTRDITDLFRHIDHIDLCTHAFQLLNDAFRRF